MLGNGGAMRFLHAIVPALILAMPCTPDAQLFAEPADAPASTGEMFPWTIHPLSATIAPGDTLTIVATLGVPEHHHVYAERTSVAVMPTEYVAVHDISAPSPELKYDKFEKRDVPQYPDTVTWRIPVSVGAERAGSTFTLQIETRTQGCSETMCYFPTQSVHDVSITVESASETSGSVSGGSVGPLDLSGTLASRGVLIALGLMFIGGILTSFTPCVYPLIPVTVGFFGAARKGAVGGFLLSVAFVLGMATMYSALGVTAAATGAVFGSIMSNPYVIGTVAAIFIAFAMSMFGAYKIQLPASAQMRLERVGGGGYAGAFLAGLVAGVIAAPCTGPVLGAALTYVATTGDLMFGFLSMFVFALGMGLLFMAIGTFSSNVVPKSGPWLAKVESLFGIVMIVAALYFLKDVIGPLRDVMRAGPAAFGVSAGLILVGLLIGAVHGRFVAGFDRAGDLLPTPSWLERIGKGIGVALVVLGSYGVIGTFLATPSVAGSSGEIVGIASPEWITDLDEGLAAARAEGRPTMIDAYADWCVACNELDAYTYSDPTVLARLEDFVSIKLDFTEATPENRELRRRLKFVGLPTVIFLGSDGEEIRDLRLEGFEPPERFLARLADIR